jgi:hypothetical protein
MRLFLPDRGSTGARGNLDHAANTRVLHVLGVVMDRWHCVRPTVILQTAARPHKDTDDAELIECAPKPAGT